MSVPVSASPVVASSTTPGLLSVAVSAVMVTSAPLPLVSIPFPPVIVMAWVDGVTAPLSVSISLTTSSPNYTAPLLTLKSDEEKLAAPFADVLASAKFIVTLPLAPPPLKLVPAVTPVISPVVVLYP